MRRALVAGTNSHPYGRALFHVKEEIADAAFSACTH